MKLKNFLFFCLSFTILLLVLSPSSFAEKDVSLEVRIDKKEITIGDRFHYEVNLIRKPTTKILSLSELKTPDFKMYKKSVIPSFEKNGRIHEGYRYTLASFDTGDKSIPPVKLEYLDTTGNRGILESNEIKLTIKSVLKNVDPLKTDIREIKSVVGIEPEYKKYLRHLYIMAGILFGFILFLILKRIFRKKVTDVDYLLTPHDEALKKLKKLRERSKSLTEETVKLFYLDLSNILRRYLERAFGMRAGELTTSEVKESFQKLNFSGGLNHQMNSFLDACDMVKFAKLIPPQEMISDDLKSAQEILEGCHQNPSELVVAVK